jgi:uncharacterized protein with GYD domain
MAKYLVEASYLSKGINGLMKEGGTRRREAVDELFGSLGGTSAAALAFRVNAAGVTTCKTTVLLTP